MALLGARDRRAAASRLRSGCSYAPIASPVLGRHLCAVPSILIASSPLQHCRASLSDAVCRTPSVGCENGFFLQVSRSRGASVWRALEWARQLERRAPRLGRWVLWACSASPGLAFWARLYFLWHQEVPRLHPLTHTCCQDAHPRIRALGAAHAPCLCWLGDAQLCVPFGDRRMGAVSWRCRRMQPCSAPVALVDNTVAPCEPRLLALAALSCLGRAVSQGCNCALCMWLLWLLGACPCRCGHGRGELAAHKYSAGTVLLLQQGAGRRGWVARAKGYQKRVRWDHPTPRASTHWRLHARHPKNA